MERFFNACLSESPISSADSFSSTVSEFEWSYVPICSREVTSNKDIFWGPKV